MDNLIVLFQFTDIFLKLIKLNNLRRLDKILLHPLSLWDAIQKGCRDKFSDNFRDNLSTRLLGNCKLRHVSKL